MATKTTLRAEIRGRRRGRRALPGTSIGAPSSDTDQTPLPVRHRAEAEGIAFQVRALASSMSADALSEALREALAPWEKVRRIVVVDELPTTATGKPDPLGAAELFSASQR